MNFEPPGMPELRWACGYPFSLALLALVCLGLF
jgi:Mg2+ and Co2+ transporter CorA